MRTWVLVLAGVLTASVPVFAPALAHEGATGIILERQKKMKALSEAMKALGAMVNSQSAFDATTVQNIARLIAGVGGQNMVDMFPQGSVDAVTSGARPEIWQNWDKFKHLADEMLHQAQTLAQTTSGQPTLRPPAPFGGGGGGSMLGGQNVMAGGPSGMPVDMTVRMNFMHLSSTCKSCHTDFRIKKH